MRRTWLAVPALCLAAACGSSGTDAQKADQVACHDVAGSLSQIGSAAGALSKGTATFSDAASVLQSAQSKLTDGSRLAESASLQQTLSRAADSVGVWRVNLLTGDPDTGTQQVASALTAVQSACRA